LNLAANGDPRFLSTGLFSMLHIRMMALTSWFHPTELFTVRVDCDIDVGQRLKNSKDDRAD
jgi:hypothetical protein